MTKGNYTVPALRRALCILELFNQQCRTLSQSEMAQALDASQSSLYRIVHTLISMGYLERAQGNRYALGPKMVSQGFSYLASRDIVEIAGPYVTDLRASTSLSSHLAIRDGSDALYVYRALAQQRVAVNVPVGTRLPCHATAMGRALLSGLSSDELKALYSSRRLDGYPAPAPQTLPELRAMIDREVERGWHVHWSDDSTAVAVAIQDVSGEVAAATNVSGPDTVMQKEGFQAHLARQLQDAARKISRQRGL